MDKWIRELQVNYLRSNCGNIIKHLLFCQNNDKSSNEYEENLKILLKLPIVLYWKNSIPKEIQLMTILGSSDTCFENSFGKLLSFGLSVEEILSEELLEKYILFLQNKERQNIYEALAQQLVASYLYAAGCNHESVYSTVIERINELYDVIKNSINKYDIYIKSSGFNIPSQYKEKKLINPILYEKNALALPLIYDMFSFSCIYSKISNQYKKKIDVIIDFIADAKYQSLDYGYGIVRTNQNKYHSIGWSVHLPLYNEDLSSDYFKRGLIHRMMIFSELKNNNIRCWQKLVLDKLEQFKIDDYRYCFPNDLLPEMKNSYYMNGRHTSLNENRKSKNGRIIESTYYAYLFGKNID